MLPAERYRDLRFGRIGFPLRATFALHADCSELDVLTSAPLPWNVSRIAQLIEAAGANAFTLWTASQERLRALGELARLDVRSRDVLEQLCTAPFPRNDDRMAAITLDGSAANAVDDT